MSFGSDFFIAQRHRQRKFRRRKDRNKGKTIKRHKQTKNTRTFHMRCEISMYNFTISQLKQMQQSLCRSQIRARGVTSSGVTSHRSLNGFPVPSLTRVPHLTSEGSFLNAWQRNNKMTAHLKMTKPKES